MKGCMVFAPNQSGPLHVGNAAVLWLTAREAMQRGLRFLIRIDNGGHCHMLTEDQIPSAYSLDTIIASLRSLQATCRLLDISPDYYWLNERTTRYREIISKMAEDGTLTMPDDGYYYMRDCPMVTDLCHGGTARRIAGLKELRCCDPTRAVMGTFIVSSYTHIVFDAMDFNIPLHIRAHDLLSEMYPEARLWTLLAETYKLTRPPLHYAHVPMVCQPNGEPLHKTGKHASKYFFENWAQSYDTPARRQRALEKIMLTPGQPYAIENMNQANEICLEE